MITLTGIGPDLELPNPDIGDAHETDLNNTINTSIDGTKTFFKGSRPSVSRYNFVFSSVRKAVKDNFKAFIIANVAEPVNLVLEDLSVIPGFIRSNEHTITTNRDGSSYSIDVVFEQLATNAPSILIFDGDCIP